MAPPNHRFLKGRYQFQCRTRAEESPRLETVVNQGFDPFIRVPLGSVVVWGFVRLADLQDFEKAYSSVLVPKSTRVDGPASMR